MGCGCLNYKYIKIYIIIEGMVHLLHQPDSYLYFISYPVLSSYLPRGNYVEQNVQCVQVAKLKIYIF